MLRLYRAVTEQYTYGDIVLSRSCVGMFKIVEVGEDKFVVGLTVSKVHGIEQI